MFNETEFRKSAEAEIIRCRSGDWKHALRVVEWVKKLGDGRSDLALIIAAAYIHDIGWRDVLPSKKITFDELLRFEGQANKNSEPFAREFLIKNEFNYGKIKIILRLIRAADAHESAMEDEAINVDADTLSKLCREHLQEKYQSSKWAKLVLIWEEKLAKRVKTKKGKEASLKLVSGLKEWLNL